MFNSEPILRNGIPIEKGVVLTNDYLERNAALLQQYLNLTQKDLKTTFLYFCFASTALKCYIYQR
jgi:hypothetical protein